MTQSYSTKMANQSTEQLLKMMSNEQILISDKLMKLEVENKEWTNRSKLRVDARKWVASKLKPKKYGDKLDVDANVEGTIKITMNLNPE